MNEDRPDRPPVLVLLQALGIRRNATIGAVVGAVAAIAAYLFRVLELWGPFQGTREYPVVGPEGWFLLLAFVLAVTSGMLVTVVLTVRAAITETRDLSTEK